MQTVKTAAFMKTNPPTGLEAFELWVAGRLTSQPVPIRRSYSPQPTLWPK